MKNRLDQLLRDENPDAIIVITPERRVVHWNRGAERIFGYDSGEAIGRSLDELIMPPDCNTKKLPDVFQQGAVTYESIRRRKDGSLVSVDISSKLILDAAADADAEFILFFCKPVPMASRLRYGRQDCFGWSRLAKVGRHEHASALS